MNLLVTNTRNGQAYCIIQSLRKQASKIIATVYGKNQFVARLSPSALSRFVNRVYYVPSLVEDWRKGFLAEPNNLAIDLFIEEILKICEREKIDVVFPSWDPQFCAFSQRKRLFTERGITLPVPEWPVLVKLIDKHRLMQEAGASGFPCPKTFLPADEGEALQAAQVIGYPLVVKPRFSSGSRGTCLARDESELRRSLRALMPVYGMPIVQEYIQGGNTCLINLILVLDHQFRMCAVHSRKVIRAVSGRFTSTTSAEVCLHDPLLAERAAGLLRALGYTGHAAFQLQLDPRDGVAKLLEINCRLSYRAWCEYEVGFDLPRLILQSEQRAEITPVPSCSREAYFIYPVEDLVGRLIGAGRKLRQPFAPERGEKPLSFARPATAGSGGAESNGRVRFSDWYFKSLRNDPLHAIAWYGGRLLSLSQELRRPAI